MKVEFKKDELVKYLIKQLAIDGLKKATKNLKDIDWNPFDDDDDEYDTPWKEMVHNKDLVVEAAMALVNTAERIVIEGNKLTSSQKHDAVVSALDKAIKLPWYAEAFDGKIISLLVTSVVKTMNALKKSAPVAVQLPPEFIAGSLNPAYTAAKKAITGGGGGVDETPLEVALSTRGKFKEIG